MTTDSPERRPVSDPTRGEVEVGTVILRGTEEWHEIDLKEMLDQEYERGRRAAAADVGPLLERLDQAENDVNEWKDWEARARGRADDLQQRLDQQAAEIERLRGLPYWVGSWVQKSIYDAKCAELAAAQARAEAIRALRETGTGWHVYETRDAGDCYLIDGVDEFLAALDSLLAGDAARPLPEPEQS